MDSDPRPWPPVDPTDDERTVDDDVRDEIPVPLDAPFDVPTVDAIDQAHTVILDDERDDPPSG
jgi:hypothetical protein